MVSKIKEENYRSAEARLWEYYQAKPQEHFIDLEKPKIKVRVLEFGEGTPVLFIHGGPNAGSTWAPIAHAMQDFHCIILDRPGCGLSDPINYAANGDLQSIALDVITPILDKLSIEQTAIVASSFGSAWALWYAATYPERVTRIVHEGCPPFLMGTQPSLFMRLMMIGPLGKIIANQPATEASQQMTFRQLGHKALIDSGNFPPIFVDWGLSMINDTDTMQNEVRLIQSASTWFGFHSDLTHYPEFLSRVPHPTLFLWGENDPFGSVEVGLRACKALPNANLLSFTASGHLPWIDDPETHVKIIRDFLMKV